MDEATFEWDDDKAAINIERHVISFDEALAVFLDDGLIIIDTSREEDREPRQKAVGFIEGKLFTVVFTMRGAVHRLISARRSNAKEERAYYGNR
jgi:uncharacterized DUF497 family protein